MSIANASILIDRYISSLAPGVAIAVRQIIEDLRSKKVEDYELCLTIGIHDNLPFNTNHPDYLSTNQTPKIRMSDLNTQFTAAPLSTLAQTNENKSRPPQSRTNTTTNSTSISDMNQNPIVIRNSVSTSDVHLISTNSKTSPISKVISPKRTVSPSTISVDKNHRSSNVFTQDPTFTALNIQSKIREEKDYKVDQMFVIQKSAPLSTPHIIKSKSLVKDTVNLVADKSIEKFLEKPSKETVFQVLSKRKVDNSTSQGKKLNSLMKQPESLDDFVTLTAGETQLLTKKDDTISDKSKLLNRPKDPQIENINVFNAATPRIEASNSSKSSTLLVGSNGSVPKKQTVYKSKPSTSVASDLKRKKLTTENLVLDKELLDSLSDNDDVEQFQILARENRMKMMKMIEDEKMKRSKNISKCHLKDKEEVIVVHGSASDMETECITLKSTLSNQNEKDKADLELKLQNLAEESKKLKEKETLEFAKMKQDMIDAKKLEVASKHHEFSRKEKAKRNEALAKSALKQIEETTCPETLGLSTPMDKKIKAHHEEDKLNTPKESKKVKEISDKIAKDTDQIRLLKEQISTNHHKESVILETTELDRKVEYSRAEIRRESTKLELERSRLLTQNNQEIQAKSSLQDMEVKRMNDANVLAAKRVEHDMVQSDNISAMKLSLAVIKSKRQTFKIEIDKLTLDLEKLRKQDADLDVTEVALSKDIGLQVVVSNLTSPTPIKTNHDHDTSIQNDNMIVTNNQELNSSSEELSADEVGAIYESEVGYSYSSASKTIALQVPAEKLKEAIIGVSDKLGGTIDELREKVMKSKKNSLLEPNLSNIDQDDTLEDGEYQPETIPVLLKPNSISQKNHRYAPYQSNQRTSNQRKVDNPTQEYVRTSRVSQRPPYHPQQQQQQPHSLQKQTLLQQQQPLQTLLQQQQQFPLQQQQQQQLLPQIPDSSSITTSMKSSSLANSTALMNPQLLGINMDASSMARVQILANIIQMQQQQQQHQQQQAQQQAQLTQSILMSMNPNLFSNVLQPQTIQSSNLLQPNTNQLNYSLQSSQGQSIPSNPFVGFHNPFIQSGHAMHNQGFNLTGSSLNQHTGDSSNQQQYHQIPTHSSIAVDRKSLEMYNLFLQSQIQSQQ